MVATAPSIWNHEQGRQPADPPPVLSLLAQPEGLGRQERPHIDGHGPDGVQDDQRSRGQEELAAVVHLDGPADLGKDVQGLVGEPARQGSPQPDQEKSQTPRPSEPPHHEDTPGRGTGSRGRPFRRASSRTLSRWSTGTCRPAMTERTPCRSGGQAGTCSGQRSPGGSPATAPHDPRAACPPPTFT